MCRICGVDDCTYCGELIGMLREASPEVVRGCVAAAGHAGAGEDEVMQVYAEVFVSGKLISEAMKNFAASGGREAAHFEQACKYMLLQSKSIIALGKILRGE